MPSKEIMTPEKMRIYNKQYYAKNKEKIAAKLYAKEECPKCGRIVSHQNINKHQKSSYCKSRCIDKSEDKFKNLEERITQYENTIDELKKIIKDRKCTTKTKTTIDMSDKEYKKNN